MKNSNVSFMKLFRFASKTDVALTILGALAAIAKGPATFIQIIFYANMLDGFIGAEMPPNGVTGCNATETSGVNM